ncbi:MAG: hypothetical protein LAP85_19375 [Acidobacteriia bacterium]|nr:hypothetical protein [Terriglobia bacterium]
MLRNGPSSFGAGEVLEVIRLLPGHAGTSTLLGTGAGAVAGYIMGSEGWDQGSDAVNGAKATGICIAAGAVVGAVVGLFIGARSRQELIYESPGR